MYVSIHIYIYISTCLNAFVPVFVCSYYQVQVLEAEVEGSRLAIFQSQETKGVMNITFPGSPSIRHVSAISSYSTDWCSYKKSIHIFFFSDIQVQYPGPISRSTKKKHPYKHLLSLVVKYASNELWLVVSIPADWWFGTLYRFI